MNLYLLRSVVAVPYGQECVEVSSIQVLCELLCNSSSHVAVKWIIIHFALIDLLMFIQLEQV